MLRSYISEDIILSIKDLVSIAPDICKDGDDESKQYISSKSDNKK